MIVTNMHRFVRLESTTAVTVQIEEAAKTAIAACAAKARDACIRLECADEPHCTTLVDPDQLAYALEELVSNAIYFSPAEGTVRIWWEVLENWSLKVNVDDEGPGIPAANDDRITRPFFSTSINGSGLGLSIVEKFCHISGGALTWQNRPGGGCRFSATLPHVGETPEVPDER